MESLLDHWLRSGLSHDWLDHLLTYASTYPGVAIGLVLALEGLAGLMLALGIGCRIASFGCALLYGLRYLIAPDGLALFVTMAAAALFVSDSGKSLHLFGRRQAGVESTPQTNPP